MDKVNDGGWTPGPWQFATVREVDFRKPESEDFMIVDAEMCCIGILWGHAWKHGLPNAHLIRTAPELYEALENLVRNNAPEHVEAARAALAKARGDA